MLRRSRQSARSAAPAPDFAPHVHRPLGSAGSTPVSAGNGAWVNFTAGAHGTLFDPTSSPAATTEMRSQAVQFAATATAPGGPFVVITNTAVLQP